MKMEIELFSLVSGWIVEIWCEVGQVVVFGVLVVIVEVVMD